MILPPEGDGASAPLPSEDDGASAPLQSEDDGAPVPLQSEDEGIAGTLRHAALRLTDTYALVMLFVFPLFTGFDGYANITLSKYLFFVAATGGYSLAIAVLALWTRVKYRTSLSQRSLSLTQVTVAIFALLCAVSAALSPYRSSVIIGAGRYDGLLTLLLYAAGFLCVSSCGKFRRIHIHALALSSVLCCAVALAQIAGHNPLGLFPHNYTYYDAHTLYTGEFLGTIGNTNILSGFLSLSIPLMAAGYVTDPDESPVLLIPAALCFFVLIASRVAGGIVALALCLLVSVPVLLTDIVRCRRALDTAAVFAITAALAVSLKTAYIDGTVSYTLSNSVYGILLTSAALIALLIRAVLTRAAVPCIRRSHSTSLPRKLTMSFALVSAIILIGGLAVAYNWRGDSGTMYELSRVLHGDIRDSFGSSRIRIWRDTLALVPDSALFGGGPDTLPLRLDIRFSRYVEETGKTLSVFVDNAHNIYIGYMANIGILGLSAYLSGIAFTTVVWLRERRHRLKPALGCALVCYWIQDFFGLGLCLTAPLLWICWGFMEAIERDEYKWPNTAFIQENSSAERIAVDDEEP